MRNTLFLCAVLLGCMPAAAQAQTSLRTGSVIELFNSRTFTSGNNTPCQTVEGGKLRITGQDQESILVAYTPPGKSDATCEGIRLSADEVTRLKEMHDLKKFRKN